MTDPRPCASSGPTRFVIPLLLFAATQMACVSSYTSALGYRARQAVLRGDVQAFDELMEEAADTLPRHPYDNPKRTVLTHFLDFGGSDLFFPMIEKWRAKDWISDNMTCAIHRARYRGVVDK